MATHCTAIIGGTSLSAIDGWFQTEQIQISTPYGAPSGPLFKGIWHDCDIVFLPRHGVESNIPPHRVNYRANLSALQQIGADNIIAVSTVGGINASLKSGDIIVPEQIIDYTYGREHTFFDQVGDTPHYTDLAQPYCQQLRGDLLRAAKQAATSCTDGGVYAITQGPRLETAAEIDRLERDGADIVGMTGMPETALAKELQLPYACCAVIVNPAAGRSRHAITMELIKHNVAVGQKKLAALFEAYFTAQATTAQPGNADA